MAISHMSELTRDTECTPGEDTPSMADKLPTSITDRDLDGNGEYTFNQVMKFSHPHDFKGVQKTKSPGSPAGDTRDILDQYISIKLDSNFDLDVSLEYGYAEALFTLSLLEEVSDENAEVGVEASHLQSPM